MSQSWTDVLAGPCHRCAFLLCLFRIPNSILFTYSICNSRSLANLVRHIFPNALYFIHFNYVYIYIVDRRIRISFRSRVVLPGWHDRESSFMILSFFRIHIHPLRETWMASVARSARSSAPFYSRFRNRCMPTTICKGAVDALVEGERTADATDLQGFAYRMLLHIRWQLYICMEQNSRYCFVIIGVSISIRSSLIANSWSNHREKKLGKFTAPVSTHSVEVFTTTSV